MSTLDICRHELAHATTCAIALTHSALSRSPHRTAVHQAKSWNFNIKCLDDCGFFAPFCSLEEDPQHPILLPPEIDAPTSLGGVLPFISLQELKDFILDRKFTSLESSGIISAEDIQAFCKVSDNVTVECAQVLFASHYLVRTTAFRKAAHTLAQVVSLSGGVDIWITPDAISTTRCKVNALRRASNDVKQFRIQLGLAA